LVTSLNRHSARNVAFYNQETSYVSNFNHYTSPFQKIITVVFLSQYTMAYYKWALM